MRLDHLLAGVEVLEVRGDPSATDVSAVVHRSAESGPGVLFCCVTGAHADGHDFAPTAVAAGAAALLVERMLPLEVAQARVSSTRQAMGPVAAAFHGHPSTRLRVVGVTGTNGKTTTTYLLQSVLDGAGLPCGVIGTLSGARTTPEAPELQATLAGFVDEGRQAVAMEVSSSAIVQHRIDGTRFAVAVFTNLGHDHLEIHPTVEDYFAAKAALFVPDLADRAVVNGDDAYGRRLVEGAAVPTEVFRRADAEGLVPTASGSRFRWRDATVDLRLVGAHNVDNALAAATTAAALGVPVQTIAAGLSRFEGVPGHAERIDAGQPFAVLVDYAHTPEALAAMLDAARGMAEGGRVVVVFGCGGDRDPSKRPLMGAAADQRADVVVVTSDNPRSEDPGAIIDDVLAGMARRGDADAVVVEPDRAEAIRRAIAMARTGDVVVVAGKGHETGQELAGGTIPFDDRDEVRRVLASVGG